MPGVVEKIESVCDNEVVCNRYRLKHSKQYLADRFQATEDVGANFVVLLVVKLADNGELLTRAYTYLPDGTKSASTVTVQS